MSARVLRGRAKNARPLLGARDVRAQAGREDTATRKVQEILGLAIIKCCRHSVDAEASARVHELLEL